MRMPVQIPIMGRGGLPVLNMSSRRRRPPALPCYFGAILGAAAGTSIAAVWKSYQWETAGMGGDYDIISVDSSGDIILYADVADLSPYAAIFVATCTALVTRDTTASVSVRQMIGTNHDAAGSDYSEWNGSVDPRNLGFSLQDGDATPTTVSGTIQLTATKVVNPCSVLPLAVDDLPDDTYSSRPVKRVYVSMLLSSSGTKSATVSNARMNCLLVPNS